MDRRQFLLTSAVTAGTLVLPAAVNPYRRRLSRLRRAFQRYCRRAPECRGLRFFRFSSDRPLEREPWHVALDLRDVRPGESPYPHEVLEALQPLMLMPGPSSYAVYPQGLAAELSCDAPKMTVGGFAGCYAVGLPDEPWVRWRRELPPFPLVDDKARQAPERIGPFRKVGYYAAACEERRRLFCGVAVYKAEWPS